MHTRCPNCSTAFRVTAEQLSAAKGRVKCGHCAEIFNAVEHLFEAPAEAEPATAEGDPEPAVAEPGPPVAEPADAQSPETDSQRLEEDSAAVPEILQRPARVTTSPLWGLGALLLAGVAVAQIGWYGREYWVQIPEGRQALERVCERVGCELPPQRAPKQVRVETRSVTSHPTLPGILRIRMTYVNRADFRQPYPVLQVTFFRDDVQPAVQRTFRPSEYLDAPPPADAVLEVGQMVYVELNVEDPGTDVTGFQFEFF